MNSGFAPDPIRARTWWHYSGLQSRYYCRTLPGAASTTTLVGKGEGRKVERLLIQHVGFGPQWPSYVK